MNVCVRAIELQDLPPFKKGLISFPPVEDKSAGAEVHLITGENGTGKTRLLSLIEAALGNSTDLKARISQAVTSTGAVLLSDKKESYIWGDSRPEGMFIYTKENLYSATINKPLTSLDGKLYNGRKEPVRAFSYRGSLRLSNADISVMKNTVIQRLETHLSLDLRPSDEDTIVLQNLSTIILKAATQFMNSGDGKYYQLNKTINDVLSSFYKEKVSLQTTDRPTFGVEVTIGDKTPMPINALPDGLRSLMAWLVATASKMEAVFPDSDKPFEEEFVLILDEPETHLHPAWQRHIIRIAQKTFPNAQIIVATHSPFIISSINEGWIHLLKRNENGEVTVSRDKCSKGDSYMDAVESVLGVQELYDPETEDLLSNFREQRESFLTSFTGEAELKKLMIKIAERSPSLENMMGREWFQIEKAKAQFNSDAETK